MKVVNAIAIAVVIACVVVVVRMMMMPAAAIDVVRAESAQHRAPFDAYATAQVGDWFAYTSAQDSKLATTRATAVSHVTTASPTQVTIATHGRQDGHTEIGASHDETVSRTKLTLEQLEGFDIGGWTMTDVATTTEPHMVNGRTFACTKLTYHSSDPMFPTKKIKTELWLSREVTVGGLVAWHEVQDLDGLVFVGDKQLVGFGSASGAAWGTRPDGL